MAILEVYSKNKNDKLSISLDEDVFKSLEDFAIRESEANGKSRSRQINDFLVRHRQELESSEPVASGYHVIKIPKGQYGDSSKIYEETMELIDGEAQGNKIMALIELADIVGAIDGYLAKHYGDQIKLEDVLKMAETTKRAFETGGRQ